jgi:hypothetical protein
MEVSMEDEVHHEVSLGKKVWNCIHLYVMYLKHDGI